MAELSNEQIARYSRHIILPEVGGKGQRKLLEGKVLIVGAGGLGSPAALYLAAAGVGTLGIIDSDEVDLSNLQRQILHSTPDLAKPKVMSAKEKLEKINPDVKVVALNQRLTAENIRELIRGYDFIIDGSDNFPTKFLVNDACVLEGKPYSHGGILRFDGQTITIVPGKGPCYRCIFESPPPPGAIPSCQEAGILGAVAGVLGTIQTTEALKFLLGVGDLLVGRLLVLNALEMSIRTLKIRKNPRCPVCGENPTITSLAEENYQPIACEI